MVSFPPLFGKMSQERLARIADDKQILVPIEAGTLLRVLRGESIDQEQRFKLCEDILEHEQNILRQRAAHNVVRDFVLASTDILAEVQWYKDYEAAQPSWIRKKRAPRVAENAGDTPY